MNSQMFSIDLIEKFAREGTLKVTTLYRKKSGMAIYELYSWEKNNRIIFLPVFNGNTRMMFFLNSKNLPISNLN